MKRQPKSDKRQSKQRAFCAAFLNDLLCHSLIQVILKTE